MSAPDVLAVMKRCHKSLLLVAADCDDFAEAASLAQAIDEVAPLLAAKAVNQVSPVQDLDGLWLDVDAFDAYPLKDYKHRTLYTGIAAVAELIEWSRHLEAFIGPSALPLLRTSFAKREAPGGACIARVHGGYDGSYVENTCTECNEFLSECECDEQKERDARLQGGA